MLHSMNRTRDLVLILSLCYGIITLHLKSLQWYVSLCNFFVLQQVVEKKYKHLTIDWALKTKVRLMSPKPFAWSLKLKASEEASGITG